MKQSPVQLTLLKGLLEAGNNMTPWGGGDKKSCPQVNKRLEMDPLIFDQVLANKPFWTSFNPFLELVNVLLLIKSVTKNDRILQEKIQKLDILGKTYFYGEDEKFVI